MLRDISRAARLAFQKGRGSEELSVAKVALVCAVILILSLRALSMLDDVSFTTSEGWDCEATQKKGYAICRIIPSPSTIKPQSTQKTP